MPVWFDARLESRTSQSHDSTIVHLCPVTSNPLARAIRPRRATPFGSGFPPVNARPIGFTYDTKATHIESLHRHPDAAVGALIGACACALAKGIMLA